LALFSGQSVVEGVVVLGFAAVLGGGPFVVPGAVDGLNAWMEECISMGWIGLLDWLEELDGLVGLVGWLEVLC
jgi:hypothetical protein